MKHAVNLWFLFLELTWLRNEWVDTYGGGGGGGGGNVSETLYSHWILLSKIFFVLYWAFL